MLTGRAQEKGQKLRTVTAFLHLFACVCVVYMLTRVGAHWVWRPEVDIWCFPQSLSSSFTEIETPPERGALQFGLPNKPAGPRILRLCLLSTEITSGPPESPELHMGDGYSSSDP